MNQWVRRAWPHTQIIIGLAEFQPLCTGSHLLHILAPANGAAAHPAHQTFGFGIILSTLSNLQTFSASTNPSTRPRTGVSPQAVALPHCCSRLTPQLPPPTSVPPSLASCWCPCSPRKQAAECRRPRPWHLHCQQAANAVTRHICPRYMFVIRDDNNTSRLLMPSPTTTLSPARYRSAHCTTPPSSEGSGLSSNWPCHSQPHCIPCRLSTGTTTTSATTNMQSMTTSCASMRNLLGYPLYSTQ